MSQFFRLVWINTKTRIKLTSQHLHKNVYYKPAGVDLSTL